MFSFGFGVADAAQDLKWRIRQAIISTPCAKPAPACPLHACSLVPFLCTMQMAAVLSLAHNSLSRLHLTLLEQAAPEDEESEEEQALNADEEEVGF